MARADGQAIDCRDLTRPRSTRTRRWTSSICAAVADVSALSRYAVVFYPHAAILTDETAALLEAYCRAGRHPGFGARTGYKDEFGRCPMRPMPGPAAELCGVTVGEYSLPHPLRPYRLLWDGAWYDAPGFIETLEPAGRPKQSARSFRRAGSAPPG